MSLRKVSVRVAQIMADRTSAVVRAIAPDESKWGDLEHLTATVIDVLIAVNSADPKKAPTVQRPGEKEAAEKRLEERKARFNARQARRAAAMRGEG